MHWLFVCSGNTCRSPMAAAYVNSLHAGITADSAGFGFGGDEANPMAKEVMWDIGVDLSAHRSKPVHPLLWDSADRVLCMTASHAARLTALGLPPHKLTVLDVADPYGQGRNVYAACRDALTEKIHALSGVVPSVVCRRATAGDYPALAALERECFSEPWSEDSLRQFAEGTGRLYAALQKGNVVGYAGISVVADEGYLANVAVTAPARRTGVGRALLTAVMRDSAAQKHAFVTLEVRPSNRAALALYRSFGFQPAGCRKAFYRDPAEDALILTRRFCYDHFEY